MTTDLTFIKPLVRKILADADNGWTVQGFGFLRTYFGPPAAPKMFRLNLWDSRFTVKGVSTIHDHPWDLSSLIVAGDFTNQRYGVTDVRDAIDSPEYMIPPKHAFMTIKTGVGGGGIEHDAVKYCTLYRREPEHYLPGDTYHQDAEEVHETLFKDGSVTLNKRVGDTEHARVFWPVGTEWVDAKPRTAHHAEIEAATAYSLREWF